MIPNTAVNSPKPIAETAMIAAMTRKAVRRPRKGAPPNLCSGPDAIVATADTVTP
jgi:hypothetical protein